MAPARGVPDARLHRERIRAHDPPDRVRQRPELLVVPAAEHDPPIDRTGRVAVQLRRVAHLWSSALKALAGTRSSRTPSRRWWSSSWPPGSAARADVRVRPVAHRRRGRGHHRSSAERPGERTDLRGPCRHQLAVGLGRQRHRDTTVASPPLTGSHARRLTDPIHAAGTTSPFSYAGRDAATGPDNQLDQNTHADIRTLRADGSRCGCLALLDGRGQAHLDVDRVEDLQSYAEFIRQRLRVGVRGDRAHIVQTTPRHVSVHHGRRPQIAGDTLARMDDQPLGHIRKYSPAFDTSSCVRPRFAPAER